MADEDTRQRRIGARLATVRAGRQLTQQQVADLLGTTVITIARWERGRRTPSVADVQRYLDACGADAAERGAVLS